MDVECINNQMHVKTLLSCISNTLPVVLVVCKNNVTVPQMCFPIGWGNAAVTTHLREVLATRNTPEVRTSITLDTTRN